jgi:hypothetical protein
MPRSVLLIEPNYQNKYPPIGLMKLATYHKMIGDKVRFFKGDLSDLICSNITEVLIRKCKVIDNTISWHSYFVEINQFIKFETEHKRLKDALEKSRYYITIKQWFEHYRNVFKNREHEKYPKYDIICITTLFTFYWNETIQTIRKAKTLIKNEGEIYVGGILATVLYDELKKEKGIKIHKGLLNQIGAYDNSKMIIDTLPLDYSILFEIDYKYPADNAYYVYSTRGCPNHCSFCAVPILEPKFNNYISIVDTIISVKKLYGDKPNLLLMDNNVLASKYFNKIIADIKECGFQRGARFIEPNYLQIYMKNLKKNINSGTFLYAVFEIYRQLLGRLKGKEKQEVYNILYDANLMDVNLITKEALIKVYPLLKIYYEKYQNKTSRQRIVDFNQGLDAYLLTEEKVKLLSEIAINPLRIAFDSIHEKKIYIKAVSLCAKYSITSLSNYLLYNENDTPEELYKRLKINIMLCEKLSISIYSFPMKYHPTSGEYCKNRGFIGKHWNRKYIRAIQTILNATKGKIGRGKSFFYEAFGKSIKEFKQLLLMPETYLLYRFFFKEMKYTEEWKNDINNLTTIERHELFRYIKDNVFDLDIYQSIKNNKIKKVYKHYLISRDEVLDPNTRIGKLKIEYDLEYFNLSVKSNHK